MWVRRGYRDRLAVAGLTSLDAVFELRKGTSLSKPGMPKYRSRLRFDVGQPPVTVYLKRYNRPAAAVQMRNWLTLGRRMPCALAELTPSLDLAAAGVAVPEIIAYGYQWGRFFEKRSFIVSRQIPGADALERRLPSCFSAPPTPAVLARRRQFIGQLASFVAGFHRTGYRHRDLYLSHIFYGDDGSLALIDLARALRPSLTAERFRLKDISQVHYSAPGSVFSNTDRLRFYLAYAGIRRLGTADKAFIRKVLRKARRMARHDHRHGRAAPFLDRRTGGTTQ